MINRGFDSVSRDVPRRGERMDVVVDEQPGFSELMINRGFDSVPKDVPRRGDRRIEAKTVRIPRPELSSGPSIEPLPVRISGLPSGDIFREPRDFRSTQMINRGFDSVPKDVPKKGDRRIEAKTVRRPRPELSSGPSIEPPPVRISGLPSGDIFRDPRDFRSTAKECFPTDDDDNCIQNCYEGVCKWLSLGKDKTEGGKTRKFIKKRRPITKKTRTIVKKKRTKKRN